MTYSTARATVKAAKPHLKPLSSTSEKVTLRAKPPEYLHASFLQTEEQRQERTLECTVRKKKQTHHVYISCVDTITDRAQGSLRPLAASLCSVKSIGVPAVFHCRQSGMDILPWPWSPPMLRANTDICKLTVILNGNYQLVYW